MTMGTLQQILNCETSVNIAWTLVHFSYQAVAIAIALAIVLKLTKKMSPNLRYANLADAQRFAPDFDILTAYLADKREGVGSE